MKLYGLHKHESYPSVVLKFSDFLFLFECPLDWKYLQNLQPVSTKITISDRLIENKSVLYENKNEKDILHNLLGLYTTIIDITLLDVILISNVYSGYALPVLIELGFKGKILMSEATFCFLKLFFEEFYKFFGNQHNLCSNNRQNQLLNKIISVYNPQNIDRIFENIKYLQYDEIYEIFSIVKITPISSGFSIGACNWIINSGNLKISAIGSSSMLNLHCTPLMLNQIKNSDIILNLSSKSNKNNQNGTAKNRDLENIIANFNQTVFKSLFESSNSSPIIIPCSSFSLFFELLESFSVHENPVSAFHLNFSQSQFYFLSPIASSLLKMASNMPEWLCTQRMSQIHYGSDACFQFNNLIKSGKLKCFSDITDIGQFEKNSIIFVSHSILQFGPVVDIMKLFHNNSTCILSDSYFPFFSEEKLMRENYRGKIIRMPIEICATFQEIDEYLNSNFDFSTIFHCNSQQIVNLGHKNISINAFVAFDTIKHINGNMTSIAGSAVKTTRDIIINMSDRKSFVTYGSISANEILEALNNIGFKDMKIEKSPVDNTSVIYTSGDELLININDNSVHIICSSKLDYLAKVKNAILGICNKI